MDLTTIAILTVLVGGFIIFYVIKVANKHPLNNDSIDKVADTVPVNENADSKQKISAKQSPSKTSSIEEKRSQRLKAKKSTTNSTLIAIIFIIFFISFFYIFSLNNTSKKNYTKCDCAEMYKKEILGYTTTFITDCLNGGFQDEVSKYVTERGWYPPMGNQKLISMGGDYFIYECE
ncbi:hypothetical protein N9546_01205 [Flavobacteriaceae bacterium]|nr:hypothetical protein [Flavobacteriaceae bacterium]